MAKDKDDKDCPHGSSWPFALGLAATIFFVAGMADPKLGPVHDMATRPESEPARKASAKKLTLYADRWVEVDTDPLKEEVGFDPQRLGNLKFLVAPDGNMAQVQTFSEYQALKLSNGHTSFWLRIAPNQGAAETQIILIRKPKFF